MPQLPLFGSSDTLDADDESAPGLPLRFVAEQTSETVMNGPDSDDQPVLLDQLLNAHVEQAR